MTCSLVSAGEAGSCVDADVPGTLFGFLASSMYSLMDISGSQGHFFIFNNLFVGRSGRFRLRLTALKPSISLPNPAYEYVAHLYTDSFTIFSGLDFPGPVDMTPLARKFREQAPGAVITAEVDPEYDGRGR